MADLPNCLQVFDANGGTWRLALEDKTIPAMAHVGVVNDKVFRWSSGGRLFEFKIR